MTQAQVGMLWAGAAIMVAIGSPNTKWIMASLAVYNFIRAFLKND